MPKRRSSPCGESTSAPSNVNVCASTCLRTRSANVTRGVEHRPRQQQHELLAAVPADAVDLAHLVREDPRELLEHRVARLVAVRVVHGS